MYQRDYILRLIEEVGKVLTAVLHLRTRGEYQEALQIVDRTLEQLLGIDSERIEALSGDQLVGLMRLTAGDRPEQSSIADRLNALGSLLQEQANIHRAEENSDAAAESGMKALDVYLAVLTEDDPTSVHAATSVGSLLPLLADYELATTTKERLWRHYELTGQYAWAENWLFELLDDALAPADIIPQGIAFYERLLSQDDEVLAVGDLPRDEVRAGLAHLRAMQSAEANGRTARG